MNYLLVLQQRWKRRAWKERDLAFVRAGERVYFNPISCIHYNDITTSPVGGTEECHSTYRRVDYEVNSRKLFGLSLALYLLE